MFAIEVNRPLCLMPHRLVFTFSAFTAFTDMQGYVHMFFLMKVTD